MTLCAVSMRFIWQTWLLLRFAIKSFSYLNLLYMTFSFNGLLSSFVPLTSFVLVNDMSCDIFVTVLLEEELEFP